MLAALERASISEVKKEQLAHGLQHIAAGEYHLAVPALIGPLEGAFWLTAQERGLVRLDDSEDWWTTEQPGRPARPAADARKRRYRDSSTSTGSHCSLLASHSRIVGRTAKARSSANR